ncbi:MAG: ferredoxin [Acidobacteria bacterium]|nr:ferredoxin [Acidobacteriota bacterium]
MEPTGLGLSAGSPGTETSARTAAAPRPVPPPVRPTEESSPAPAEPEPEAAAPIDGGAGADGAAGVDGDLEAYIDTELCTTCNECIQINPKIFVYNENKQAYVADAAAGPFRDLVKAAEKCSAKIIHPGSPLDPSEPGLAGWVERARPFN